METYKVNVGPCSVFEGRFISLWMAVLWRSERPHRGSFAPRKFCLDVLHLSITVYDVIWDGVVFLWFVWVLYGFDIFWLKKMHEVILRDRNASSLRMVFVEDTAQHRCSSGGPGLALVHSFSGMYRFLHCLAMILMYSIIQLFICWNIYLYINNYIIY